MAFGAAIQASFGGDTGDLRKAVSESVQLVDQLDARFAETGVVLAEGPKKLAAESAKAFDQIAADAGEWAQLQAQEFAREEERTRKRAADSAAVFEQAFADEERLAAAKEQAAAEQQRSEQTLAEFRRRSAFDELSTTDKIRSVRREMLALLQQIDQSEAGSTERNKLALTYEEKKVQLRNLLKVAAREEADQAARLPPELEKANQKMSALQKGWNNLTKGFSLPNIGTTLATALGINLQSMAEQVARFFTGVTKAEEDALKRLDQLSTQVADKNIANMRARLTDEQRYQLAISERDRLEQRIAERVIKTTADQVAAKEDELAMANRIAEIHEYEAKLAEKRQKQIAEEMKLRAEANEKQFQAQLDELGALDRIRVLKESIAAIEAGLRSNVLSVKDAEMFRATLQERQNQLVQEESRLRKETAEAVKLDRDETLEQIRLEQRGVANLTGVERARYDVLKLITAEKRVTAQIDDILDKGAANITKADRGRLESLSKQHTVLEQQIDAKKQIVEEIKRQAAAESEVTAELQEQVMYKSRLDIRQGRADKDLSDRELAEKIQNLKKNLSDLAQSDPTGHWSFLGNVDRQALENATFEQQRRADFRRNYARMGEEAFNKYSAFDEQTLRQYIRPEDERRQQEQLDSIRSIDQRLRRLLGEA